MRPGGGPTSWPTLGAVAPVVAPDPPAFADMLPRSSGAPTAPLSAAGGGPATGAGCPTEATAGLPGIEPRLCGAPGAVGFWLGSNTSDRRPGADAGGAAGGPAVGAAP